jgi:hypothetical protein
MISLSMNLLVLFCIWSDSTVLVHDGQGTEPRKIRVSEMLVDSPVELRSDVLKAIVIVL